MELMQHNFSITPTRTPSFLISFLEEDQIANQAAANSLCHWEGRILSSTPQAGEIRLNQEERQALEDFLDEPLLLIGNEERFPLKIPMTLRLFLELKWEALKEIKPQLHLEDVPFCCFFGPGVDFYMPMAYRQKIFNDLLKAQGSSCPNLDPSSLATPHLKRILQPAPIYHFDLNLSTCTSEDIEKIHEKILEILTQKTPMQFDRQQVEGYLQKLKAKVLTKQFQHPYLLKALEGIQFNENEKELMRTMVRVNACYARMVVDSRHHFHFTTWRFQSLKTQKNHTYTFYGNIHPKKRFSFMHPFSLALDPLLLSSKESIIPKSLNSNLFQDHFAQATALISVGSAENFGRGSWPALMMEITQNGRCRVENLHEAVLEVFLNALKKDKKSLADVLIGILKKEALALNKDPNWVFAFCYNMCAALKTKKGNLYDHEIQALWRVLFDYIDGLEKYENKSARPLIEKMQIIMRNPLFLFKDLHAAVHAYCYVRLNALMPSQDEAFSVSLTQSDGFDPHIQLRIYLEDKEANNERPFVSLLFPLDAQQFVSLRSLNAKILQDLDILYNALMEESRPSFLSNQSRLRPFKNFAPFQFKNFKAITEMYLAGSNPLFLQNLALNLAGSMLAQDFNAHFWLVCVKKLVQNSQQKEFYALFPFLMAMAGSSPLQASLAKQQDYAVAFQAFEKDQNPFSFAQVCLALARSEEVMFQEAALVLLKSPLVHLTSLSNEDLIALLLALTQQKRFSHCQLFLEKWQPKLPVDAMLSLLGQWGERLCFVDKGFFKMNFGSYLELLRKTLERKKSFASWDVTQQFEDLLHLLISEGVFLESFQLLSTLLKGKVLKSNQHTALIWIKIGNNIAWGSESIYAWQHLQVGYTYGIWNLLSEGERSHYLEKIPADPKKGALNINGKLTQLTHQIFQTVSSHIQILYQEKIDRCGQLSDWIKTLNFIETTQVETLWEIDFQILQKYLNLSLLKNSTSIPKVIQKAFEHFLQRTVRFYGKQYPEEMGNVLLDAHRQGRLDWSDWEADFPSLLDLIGALANKNSALFLTNCEAFLVILSAFEHGLVGQVQMVFWKLILDKVSENRQSFSLLLYFFSEHFTPAEWDIQLSSSSKKTLEELCLAAGDLQIDLSLLKWIYRAYYFDLDSRCLEVVYQNIVDQFEQTEDDLGLKQWLMEFALKNPKGFGPKISSLIVRLLQKGCSQNALDLLKKYEKPFLIAFKEDTVQIAALLERNELLATLAHLLIAAGFKELSDENAEAIKKCVRRLLKPCLLFLDHQCRISKSNKNLQWACKLLMTYQTADLADWEAAYQLCTYSNNKSLKIQMLTFLHEQGAALNLPEGKLLQAYAWSIKGLERSGAGILLTALCDLENFGRLLMVAPPQEARAIFISLLEGTIKLLLKAPGLRSKIKPVVEFMEAQADQFEFIDPKFLFLYVSYLNALAGVPETLEKALLFLTISFSNGHLNLTEEKVALDIAHYLIDLYGRDPAVFLRSDQLQLYIIYLSGLLLMDHARQINPVYILRFLSKVKGFAILTLYFKVLAIREILSQRLPVDTPELIGATVKEVLSKQHAYRIYLYQECLDHPALGDYLTDAELLRQAKTYFRMMLSRPFYRKILEKDWYNRQLLSILFKRTMSLYTSSATRKVYSFQMMNSEKTALKQFLFLRLITGIIALGILVAGMAAFYRRNSSD